MWIKLTITIVTLLLLFDEYFKVIDKVRKSNRRKIILIALAILSFLSLVDVVIEVNEGDELVKKANKIISQSDTLISNTNSIIMDLGVNIKSVEKTGKSIIGIDSVLKGIRDSVSSQVEILKNVISKSVELVKLEELKFEQDEAKIIAENSDILLVENKFDSTLFSIKYYVINKGIRKAVNINFNFLLLLYKKSLDQFSIIIDSGNSYFSEDIVSNTKGGLTIDTHIIKEKLVNDFDTIILILKCEYQDAIFKKILNYKGDFIAKQLKSPDIEFHFLADYEFAKKINQVLIKKNHKEYLIDLDKY